MSITCRILGALVVGTIGLSGEGSLARGEPQTGKKAADLYFFKRKKKETNYFVLQVGLLEKTLSASYLKASWLGGRMWLHFDLSREKITFMPVLIFPSTRRAPSSVYLGAGLGFGLLLSQIDREFLSLESHLLIGVRWLKLLKYVGVTFEGGFNQHIHTFSYSRGIHRGWFVRAGMAFSNSRQK